MSFHKLHFPLYYLPPTVSEDLCMSLSLSSTVRVVRHQISPVHYEDVVGDDLINLAVVLEDPSNQQRVLACEEFNIESPQLDVEVG